MRAAVTLNPSTPVSAIADAIRDADHVLCMSVDPGWGGQVFIEESYARLREIRGRAARCGPLAARDLGAQCLDLGACLVQLTTGHQGGDAEPYAGEKQHPTGRDHRGADPSTSTPRSFRVGVGVGVGFVIGGWVLGHGFVRMALQRMA